MFSHSSKLIVMRHARFRKIEINLFADKVFNVFFFKLHCIHIQYKHK